MKTPAIGLEYIVRDVENDLCLMNLFFKAKVTILEEKKERDFKSGFCYFEQFVEGSEQGFWQ